MTSPNGYQLRAEDKFSLGLWTVGNPGPDAFGDAARQKISPIEIVCLLAEVGAWGEEGPDVLEFGKIGLNNQYAMNQTAQNEGNSRPRAAGRIPQP